MLSMMTSSNGNIFRVTGPWCGEFTGPGKFPTQRSVTRSFDVFFDLRLNKRSSKQPWGWWFETPSMSLWRHCNGNIQARYGLYMHWKGLHIYMFECMHRAKRRMRTYKSILIYICVCIYVYIHTSTYHRHCILLITNYLAEERHQYLQIIKTISWSAFSHRYSRFSNKNNVSVGHKCVMRFIWLCMTPPCRWRLQNVKTQGFEYSCCNIYMTHMEHTPQLVSLFERWTN